jgi:hypothetical protein
VAKGLKDLILQAVDEDFLLEQQDEGIVDLNVTLIQMLIHLQDCWGSMDFTDITALMTECDFTHGMLPKYQLNILTESTRRGDNLRGIMFKSMREQ